jgi:hypothetical protein
MEYLVLAAVSVGCIGLILFIRKMFLKNHYPKKTEKLYGDLKQLETMGLTFKGDRYEGNFKGFQTYIYVTTNMRGSDQVFVSIAVDPSSGSLDMNTFFSGYFVTGEDPRCKYVGFRLFMRALFDPAQGVQARLEKLIQLLQERGVQPFKMGA